MLSWVSPFKTYGIPVKLRILPLDVRSENEPFRPDTFRLHGRRKRDGGTRPSQSKNQRETSPRNADISIGESGVKDHRGKVNHPP